MTSLDNEVDTTTGTVKFRATFVNHKLVLFPNQFVNARLLVRTLRAVTLVPSAAVQLMVALFLAGGVSYFQIPVSALAGGCWDVTQLPSPSQVTSKESARSVGSTP